MNPKTGLLLVNLGTPDAPTRGAVAKYLREFLSDEKVIDIPAPLRLLLVHGIIVPTRSGKSAHAYSKVWTDRGSPLMLHSLDLLAAMRKRMPDTLVDLAMRYGSPSIEHGLKQLVAHGATRIVVFPLYPQLADSSTGTAIAKVEQVVNRMNPRPQVEFIPAFYDDPGFLDAFAAVGRPVVTEQRPDHVLFSFHGLPERHIKRADPSGGHCLASPDCCAVMRAANKDCYRAQCYATAKGIAEQLALAPADYSVAFQSRLGRTPWIQPFTDLVLPELVKKGKRNIVVYCPAFVADCLETLEEIGMRAKEQVEALGGKVTLVPSLNAHPAWVEAAARIVEPYFRA